MNILGQKKLEVPKKYVYLSALLFSVAVILQVSSTELSLNYKVYLRHIVLFSSIYFFWAMSINFINEIGSPFSKKKSKYIQLIEKSISIFLLVVFNLVATNVIYYFILIVFMDYSFTESYLDFKPFVFQSFVIRLVDVVVIGIILKIINAFQKVQDQKLKLITLENQLHVSQLETLRNQLDPHFLFNSLHTLNTFIGYDDKKARKMLIKITALLRKILEKREMQTITFEEELEYFTNYLDIEKERFYDRLEVIISVDENTKKIKVPTLILQPLIENAFKHGIAQIESNGKITFRAFIEKDIFVIVLSNTIPVNENLFQVNSTNIGLQNLKSRLNQLYGNQYSFTTKRVDKIYTAEIRINQF